MKWQKEHKQNSGVESAVSKQEPDKGAVQAFTVLSLRKIMEVVL